MLSAPQARKKSEWEHSSWLEALLPHEIFHEMFHWTLPEPPLNSTRRKSLRTCLSYKVLSTRITLKRKQPRLEDEYLPISSPLTKTTRADKRQFYWILPFRRMEGRECSSKRKVEDTCMCDHPFWSKSDLVSIYFHEWTCYHARETHTTLTWIQEAKTANCLYGGM